MWKTPALPILLTSLLLGLSPLASADGINGSAVLGAGLGAAAGAAVGSAMGGREGAVVGGAIGGAAGAAVGSDQRQPRPRAAREVVVAPSYGYDPRYHEDRGWHRGHYEHGRGHGRDWEHHDHHHDD